jgi:hypothetical protein
MHKGPLGKPENVLQPPVEQREVDQLEASR